MFTNPYPEHSAQHASASATSSSDGSEHSESTAPTVDSRRHAMKQDTSLPFYTAEARDSSVTYASTVPSSEELPEEPRYEVATDRYETVPTNTIPSNSSTFADLWPSARRLVIRHDDSTIDGNMNLCVDTLIPGDRGRQQEVTLYHLRMHDLHTRKFSFRRYCRDSGREVCHSTRKMNPSVTPKRPVRRRSWSSVLSSLRPGSNGTATAVTHLNRQDSGYRSGADEEAAEDDGHSSAGSEPTSALTNTLLLEFSNYAHVDLRRRGAKSSKRYEFEYWSTKYQWRRDTRKDGDFTEVSYHLVDTGHSRPVAHIVPEVLTPMDVVEEEGKGGWVPPCSFWISDESVYERMHDVAE